MKKHKWKIRKSGYRCDNDRRTHGTYNYIVSCPNCMSIFSTRVEIGTARETLPKYGDVAFGGDCEEALKQNMIERLRTRKEQSELSGFRCL